jgi:hypothetical protein
MGLCLDQVGDKSVSREALSLIETPAATSTWKPVGHAEIANLVCGEAKRRGLEITAEDWGLNSNQKKMFGVIRFNPHGHPEYSRSIGIRNSINKSLSVGLTCGVNVFVCSNLCFGGEAVIMRKHTIGIEIEELIPQAFDSLNLEFERLEAGIVRMKKQILTISGAKLFTIKASEIGAINSSDIVPVINEFRNPRHEEFKGMTVWNLYNAMTEIVKKYTPMRVEKTYSKLGELFNIN